MQPIHKKRTCVSTAKLILPRDIWWSILQGAYCNWKTFYAASRCNKKLYEVCNLQKEHHLQAALLLRREAHYEEACVALIKSAIGGSADALNHLGYAFEAGGWALEQNARLSFLCFLRSACLGNSVGLAETATGLYWGTGCEQDIIKAREYADKVSDSDSYATAITKYELEQYKEDDLVTGLGFPSIKTMVSWFVQSALDGNEYAQCTLADGYSLCDFEQAGYWYRCAALQGNAEAAYKLANIYYGQLNQGEEYAWRNKAVAQKYSRALGKI